MVQLIERGKREPGASMYGTVGVGSPLQIGVRTIEEASARPHIDGGKRLVLSITDKTSSRMEAHLRRARWP